jgi:hypothetical protein
MTRRDPPTEEETIEALKASRWGAVGGPMVTERKDLADKVNAIVRDAYLSVDHSHSHTIAASSVRVAPLDPWEDVECTACGFDITEYDRTLRGEDGRILRHADCKDAAVGAAMRAARSAGVIRLPPEMVVGDDGSTAGIDAIRRLLACDLYTDGTDSDRNGKAHWEHVKTPHGDIYTAGDLLDYILNGTVEWPDGTKPKFVWPDPL